MKKYSPSSVQAQFRGFLCVCFVATGMFVSLMSSDAMAQAPGYGMSSGYGIASGYGTTQSYPIVEAHGIQPIYGGSPSYSPGYNATPGFSPVILPRGEYRDAIKAMPIESRPYRPFHFYGNTVRRNYYRNQTIRGGSAIGTNAGLYPGAW